MSTSDSPRLEAEITDSTLEIRVRDGQEIVEHHSTDIAMLLQTNQYVASFNSPIMTLLTLYQSELAQEQNIDDEPTELGDPEIEGTPTQS